MTLGPDVNARRSVPGIVGWWQATVGEGSLIVPDGGVDVIWTPGRMPWICGPDTRPASSVAPAGAHVTGLRLEPGAVSTLIGESAARIVDRRVPIEAILRGAVARRLFDALHAAESDEAPARFATLIGELMGRDWKPDPFVLREIDRIVGHAAGPPPNLGGRQLRRRFTDAVGYGPKTFERIQRLDRFVRSAAVCRSRSLAELADQVGYHDQAHLCRDARALAGQTPTELAGRRSG